MTNVHEEMAEKDLTPFIVYFNDGTFLEFKAACEIGAKEYAEYRAKIRGTSVNAVDQIG